LKFFARADKSVKQPVELLATWDDEVFIHYT